MKITPEDIPDDDVRKWFKSKNNNVLIEPNKPNKPKKLSNDLSGEVIDKFKTLREYDIDYDLPSVDWRQELPVMVVYCVWSQPLYFKCLYLSILSQIKFTDIYRTKLVIFVAQDLYEEACSVFGGIDILIVPFHEKFFKHIVFSHDIIQNFDGKIALFDCDTFMYSHNGKHNLYSQIANLASNGIYMMKDPDDARKVFYDRKSLIPQNVSSDEYGQMWSDIMGKDIKTIIPPDVPWKLACANVFDAAFFKTPGWKEHVEKCWDLRTGCDETVFLTHAWSNNISVDHVDDFPGVGVYRVGKSVDFVNDTSHKDLGILHPLHGSFCHDMRMQEIYNGILDSRHLDSRHLDSRHLDSRHLDSRHLDSRHLDIVTSAFYNPDLPLSQDVVDLYLYHLEKNMDMPFTVHFFSEISPEVNYCKSNFIWHRHDDYRSKDWTEIFCAYEKHLGCSNYPVLCTHIDSYLTGGVKDIVSKLVNEDYFYIGAATDVEYRKLPLENVYIPSLCFAWGLLNPLKWRDHECRILDCDVIHIARYSSFFQELLGGLVYQWDRSNCMLLTIYLQLLGEKVYFVKRPMIHITGTGNLPRTISARLIEKRIRIKDAPWLAWNRFNIRGLASFYKSVFDKDISLDVIKDENY